MRFEYLVRTRIHWFDNLDLGYILVIAVVTYLYGEVLHSVLLVVPVYDIYPQHLSVRPRYAALLGWCDIICEPDDAIVK